MTEQDSPLPQYRLLTGPDDASFCRRVSEMLDNGYVLYGSPCLAWDPAKQCMMAAQAIILKAP
ncbi:DUF1737 domain-containing protein [Tatumella ptyseos]|uniref:DUF1737 domain-containing protein n=1 Tax=Tatumella ptyseos TaxID=82987 RepID=UPI0026F339F6|nr:DUF1737 domain-containing protein [Tatumella ptyseos]WKX27466.1 DUF1737 domain-containing protein [Tatumella ptyseos]